MERENCPCSSCGFQRGNRVLTLRLGRAPTRSQTSPPPIKKYKQSKFGVFREFPVISASKSKYIWQVYIGIWGGEIPVCYNLSLNSLVLITLIRINQPDGRRCSSFENISKPFFVRFLGKEYF